MSRTEENEAPQTEQASAGSEEVAPEPALDEAEPAAEGTTGSPSEEIPEAATPGEGETVTVSAEEWRTVQEQQAQLEDRWLRLQAEFDNFRKRTARERGQAYAAAVEEVTRSFLPVVDNCDRAIAAAEAEGFSEEHLTGWRLIHRQLYDVLRGLNVQPLEVIGEPFNPHFHEAVAEVPDDTVPPGHIAHEVERGYVIGDRVLRTAKVTVSRGVAADTSEEEQ